MLTATLWSEEEKALAERKRQKSYMFLYIFTAGVKTIKKCKIIIKKWQSTMWNRWAALKNNSALQSNKNFCWFIFYGSMKEKKSFYFRFDDYVFSL